jgi:type IV secretion system protein VirB8
MERRSARRAWWVAGAGWSASLALAAGILVLTPLKSVEPFVIRVDNATGLVDVVPVYAGREAMPEAVSRYFLTHYVTVCERFNFPTAESDYEECGSFHTAERNQVWYAAWRKRIPHRP